MADNDLKTLEFEAATLREILRVQTIAAAAVAKAQAENRRLGIPNWYSINGEIVSDQQLEAAAKAA